MNPAIECDMLHIDATKPTALPGLYSHFSRTPWEPEAEATSFLTK
jgi:hypothetical protein